MSGDLADIVKAETNATLYTTIPYTCPSDRNRQFSRRFNSAYGKYNSSKFYLLAVKAGETMELSIYRISHFIAWNGILCRFPSLHQDGSLRCLVVVYISKI